MSSHGKPDSDRHEKKKIASGKSSPAAVSRENSSSTAPTQSNSDDAHHEETAAKTQAILDACIRSDIPALADLAVSEGGFLSDDLRRHACE